MLNKVTIGVMTALIAATVIAHASLFGRVSVVESKVEYQKSDIKEIKTDVKYLVRNANECKGK